MATIIRMFESAKTRKEFIQFIKSHPLLKNLNSINFENLISEELISPYTIELPLEVLNKIKSEVKKIYNLRKFSEHHLAAEFKEKNLPQSKNKAVCTSYDFHLTEQLEPKLIEVNTNASFLAMGLLTYEFFKVDCPTSFNYQKLIEMFINEIKLEHCLPNQILIIDEKPDQQRLFIEFLIYKSLLENAGIRCQISDLFEIENFLDFNQLSADRRAFIYNRSTDFYLIEQKSETLLNLYKKNLISLSPSPYEYFLLADKQRLFDWQNQTEIEKPASLLKIFDLKNENKDEIWSNRKNLFFKPKSSYGGKQVYKGASISKKFFDQTFQGDFIAQEYVPASEVTFVINSAEQKFKFDLRCYAYQDEVQLIIARLYQGQTTNLKTAGGGFAVINFI